MNCTTCKIWNDCRKNNWRKWENAYNWFTKAGFVCIFYEPTFITPMQYRERKGEEYPNDGPVWYANSDSPKDGWYLDHYIDALDDERCYIVCANRSDGAMPSNDWRP
jgi:hypothetical protein